MINPSALHYQCPCLQHMMTSPLIYLDAATLFPMQGGSCKITHFLFFCFFNLFVSFQDVLSVQICYKLLNLFFQIILFSSAGVHQTYPLISPLMIFYIVLYDFNLLPGVKQEASYSAVLKCNQQCEWSCAHSDFNFKSVYMTVGISAVTKSGCHCLH